MASLRAQAATSTATSALVRRLAPTAALFAAIAVALAGCGPSHQGSASRRATAVSQARSTRRSHRGLVGYPAFLPKRTLDYDSDALVVGTAGKPALTNQGDPIEVVTPGWSVLAVISGPEVPGEGLPYQTSFTTCTWTVTLSKATGRVPISISDFDSIDDRGNLYRPQLVAGQPAPARFLQPGERVSFELRAYEAVGEGLMRWAPIGGRIVGKWDFVVEND